MPALIVRSRSQSFALPQGALSELVHLPPDQVNEQVEWLEGAALYRLRGKLLPLIFLDSLLKQRERMDESQDAYIAVLNAEGRRYGIVVDGLADPEEIVVKPLSSVLKRIGLFSGATVLGNGEMVLILDPGAIATHSNITMSIEDDESEVLDLNASVASAEYLLMESASERMSVPLDSVLRIERIPRTQMEQLNGISILRFDGTLLPVEDKTCVDVAPTEKEMTVVVCHDRGRHVGIAVEQVLDVVQGESLTEAGTNAATRDAILLRDKVTSIVNLRQIQALPSTHVSQGEVEETWVEAERMEASA